MTIAENGRECEQVGFAVGGEHLFYVCSMFVQKCLGKLHLIRIECSSFLKLSRGGKSPKLVFDPLFQLIPSNQISERYSHTAGF